ncbi:OmpA family protein [Rhodovulum sp. DZ06]|uniref:OmpA family protein n=1 Tax=Rhodovulum sp. DZ06 TaxID=3425126 RepID=UPI003D340301
MNFIRTCVCAAFIGAAAAPMAAFAADDDAISDIKARLALQRQGVSNDSVRTEATRGIEEFRPSQLRKSATPAPAPEVAAAPSASEAGVSVAAARPARANPEPRVIAAQDTEGKVIQVKIHDAAMDISKPVRFAYNSAFLTDQARAVLDVYCAAIKGSEAQNGPAPGGYVLIGHADASGDAEYNRVLSQKRAEESRRYMVDQCGLPAANLRAVGLGEDALKDPSRPTAAVNRRVELQIGS